MYAFGLVHVSLTHPTIRSCSAKQVDHRFAAAVDPENHYDAAPSRGSQSIAVRIFILPQKKYSKNPEFYKMLEYNVFFPLVNILNQNIGPPES